jgi:hypothetical protein
LNEGHPDAPDCLLTSRAIASASLGIVPGERTSPLGSATATAIVSL